VHRSARLSFRVQELIRAAIQPVGEVGAPIENKNAEKSKNNVRNTNIESKPKPARHDNAAYIIRRLKFWSPFVASPQNLPAVSCAPLPQQHPWSD